MANAPDDPGKSKRPLEPIERISELLFGLVMVLTYTTAIAPGKEDGEALHAMLASALGCNLAWGIIDAVLYLMNSMAERSRGLMRLHAVRNTTDPQEAQRLIADALPPVVASILQPKEFESLHHRLKQLPQPPRWPRLRKDEWLGAVGIFLLVFVSTFPVAVPFMFMSSATLALHVSNAIAIALLFGLGYAYGHCTGRTPWIWGVVMVIVGAAMVGMCKALGG
jgi:hypothetical protein